MAFCNAIDGMMAFVGEAAARGETPPILARSEGGVSAVRQEMVGMAEAWTEISKLFDHDQHRNPMVVHRKCINKVASRDTTTTRS